MDAKGKSDMNVFLDTEFTDLLDPVLISIGMVAESGEEFYAEVPYTEERCTAFVREAVLPLLGKIPNAACSAFDLRVEMLTWLEIIRHKGEEVLICADNQTDLDLLCHGLDYRAPGWLAGALIGSKIDETLLNEFFTKSGLPRHHALYDARANRHAYRSCRRGEDACRKVEFG
jgi:hypothetical protein